MLSIDSLFREKYKYETNFAGCIKKNKIIIVKLRIEDFRIQNIRISRKKGSSIAVFYLVIDYYRDHYIHFILY